MSSELISKQEVLEEIQNLKGALDLDSEYERGMLDGYLEVARVIGLMPTVLRISYDGSYVYDEKMGGESE